MFIVKKKRLVQQYKILFPRSKEQSPSDSALLMLKIAIRIIAGNN